MSNDFRRIYLPYCLDKQPDGRYAVLNRDYKPLGFNTKEFITYDEFPVLTRFKRMAAATITKLSWNADPNPDRIYLYNDGGVPTSRAADMSAYLARLAVLAKLTIDRASK